MLNSLTSFRFIAALMVFIFHLGILKQYQLGSAGVQFFFVLSGFILAYNYHSKLTNLSKEKIKKFYRARFSKIYPVHVLTFLIASPLVILYFKPDGLYFIKLAFMSAVNLLLIQTFIPIQSTYFNFNGVSWTLSVEAIFYLTFPFLIWTFTKLKINKHIFKTCLFLFIIWLTLFILNMRIDESDHFKVWLMHIFPFVRLFEFSTGIILGMIFANRPMKNLNKKMFNLLELFAVLLFLIFLLISVRFDTGLVRGVYFVPIWCILIYTFAHEVGILSKLLSSKVLVYLGEISFSFYMIHQLVIRYFEFLKLNSIVNFLICLVLSLLLSAVIYRFYEEPLRKRLRYGKKRDDKQNVIVQPSLTSN